MAVYDVTGSPVSTVYALDGTPLTQAYNINGEPLLSSHAVSDRYIASLEQSISEIASGTQGIACDSVTQTIAQLYPGKIIMINLSDGSYTQVASSFNLGHGSTGQFAPTKEPEQDYPLLYVSHAGGVAVDDVTYDLLLEVQCSSSSSKMKKIFAVNEPDNRLGHFAIDFENEIIYHTYHEAYESPTAEYTYISAWDMNEYTSFSDLPYTVSGGVEDGKYLLTNKLFSFAIPFVNKQQSTSFFDGLIALFSDEGYVQFVDPVSKSVYLTINRDMPVYEREGIGFVLNETTGQYDMILSNRANGSASYYRYQFIL